jgi:hypothetical protein
VIEAQSTRLHSPVAAPDGGCSTAESGTAWPFGTAATGVERPWTFRSSGSPVQSGSAVAVVGQCRPATRRQHRPSSSHDRARWLLYLGDKYAATLTATRTGLTQKDAVRAQEISESMMEWNGWLSRQGVSRFRIMIGPNKDSVHPEGLPSWAAPRQPAKVHALAIGSAGVLYVDLRDGLRQLAMQETEPLYYRTDTHWNALGAANALTLFAASLDNVDLGLRWPTDGGIRLVRVDSRLGGDLARFLRLEDSLVDREPVIYLPVDAAHDTTVTDYDTNELVRTRGNAAVSYPKQIVRVHSPQALNQRRVLWVRDSFALHYRPTWQQPSATLCSCTMTRRLRTKDSN